MCFACKKYYYSYYSDTEFDCRIFHYCKKNGFKFTFICPGSAVFNQKELTCDSRDSRNSERMCRSSANYYFLNSMLYSKDKSPLPQLLMGQHEHIASASSLSPEVESISSEAITNGDEMESASEDALADADTFGKWVTYISTVPLPTVMSSSSSSTFSEKRGGSLKSRTKPKRNRVHFDESSAVLVSASSSSKLPMLKMSAGKRKLERHSSELSVIHSPSSSFSSILPDFLLTSPSPPVEQIDTPRWFPEKQQGNASATDFSEHLKSESVNKYSVDGESLKDTIITATVSTAQSPTDRLKAPSEVNEVVIGNAIDESPLNSPVSAVGGPSKEVLLFPGQAVNRQPFLHQQGGPQTQIQASAKPGRQQQQQHSPFQVDWDDDDQLLVNQFHKLQNSKGLVNGNGNNNEGGSMSNGIIRGPVNEETVNYLYGKPMEPLPTVQFSPVDFESLLEKLPQHPIHTLPLMSPSFMELPYHHHHHQQQMMAHFGQFAPSDGALMPKTPKAKHSPKSQFKVLFGNLVRGASGGGHTKINRRRWSGGRTGGAEEEASTLPLIWPLMMSPMMVNGGGGNSFKRLDNVRQHRPSYTQLPSSWRQSITHHHLPPVQMIQLQRRTDRGLHQYRASPPPPADWKTSSLVSLLSRRLTSSNRSNNNNRSMF